MRRPAQPNTMEELETTTPQDHRTTTIPQPKKQWVKPAMEVMKVDNNRDSSGSDAIGYAS